MKTKRKLLIFVFFLVVFVLLAIFYTAGRNENQDGNGTQEAAGTGESGTEVTEYMKDAAEMDALYGDYLADHPVDFLSGEVEVSIPTAPDSPVLTVSNGTGDRYFSLADGADTFEEYIQDEEIIRHTAGSSGEQWSRTTLDGGEETAEAEIQSLFSQTMEAMNLGEVVSFLNEAPELRYQNTVVIGDLELDVFACVHTDPAEEDRPAGDMPEDEYEAYVESLEAEAQKALEELENNEEALFEVPDDEVGAVYLYLDTNSESLRFISAAFGENSSANIIFRDSGDYSGNIPVDTEISDDGNTSAIFEDLLVRCTESTSAE